MEHDGVNSLERIVRSLLGMHAREQLPKKEREGISW